MMPVKPLKMGQTSGFTLVELMVSLTLGLLVLGLLLAVYLNNMQTARFQNGVLRVQENGRFAVDMMTRVVRMAGYDDPSGAGTVSVSMDGAASGADATIVRDNVKSGTDIIAVTFEGGDCATDGQCIRDCQGILIPDDTVRTSQFFVRTDSNLVCITDAAGAVEMEMAEGIEGMRIRYGVDPDGNGVPNHYSDSANVGSNWDRIATVEITLLVNSIENVLRVSETVCIGCTVFAGSNDLMVRGEFQTVVAVRNLEIP